MSKPISAPGILIVDDEPQALKYFRMGLAADFSISVAASAAEAQEVLRKSGDAIAVLITDQRMPERTGASLLASVRQSHPAIIRILTTAYSDLEGAIEAVNKGEVFRYITKPWNLDALRQEMRIAVQVYELQRDRDALLVEKLSVKQRLKAAERARHLVAISGALPSIGRLHEAIAAYISDMAAFAGDSKSNQIPLDMWADAEAEAAFGQAIAKEMVGLAAEMKSGAPSPQWVRELLAASLSAWLVTECAMSEVTSAETVTLTAKGPLKVQACDPLLFAAPTGGDASTKLLKAYAVVYAQGGALTVRCEGGMVEARAQVPTVGKAVPQVDAERLNRDIFRSLERWV